MWTLLAEGGYARVYINAERTEVKKVLPRYVEDEGQMHFNYSAIMDIGVQKSFGKKIPGVPEISRYEVDDNAITMYMPYYGVPINELEKTSICNPEFVTHVISRLCEILISLEHNGIYHTDLKPCNILYDVATREVTLIDYNIISQIVCHKQKKILTPGYGTWAYSSPEVILYTHPTDTSSSWVVGLLMAYLYARYPWSGLYKLTQSQIRSRTAWKQEILKMRTNYIDHFPLSAAHEHIMPSEHVALYKQCMKWNWRDRPLLLDVYCQLVNNHGMSPPNIHVVNHSITLNASISKDSRFIALTKLYNICRITKTLHVYLRSVSIFERSYTCTSRFTLFEHGCATHCLALMMMGSYVFDSAEFVSTITTYWQLNDIRAVQEAVWWIASSCDWKLWDLPADVMLIDSECNVNYEEIKNMIISYDNRTYDMNTIFKDMKAIKS